MHKVTVRQEIIDRVLARRGRYHWFDELDPRRTALVVIDVDSEYLQTRCLVGPEAPIERAELHRARRTATAPETEHHHFAAMLRQTHVAARDPVQREVRRFLTKKRIRRGRRRERARGQHRSAEDLPHSVQATHACALE